MIFTRARCSVAACTIAGLLAGINLSQFSGLLDVNSFRTSFSSLSASSKSLLSAALLFGAMVGTPLAGPLVESQGRRLSILVCGVLFAVAASTVACAHTTSTLTLGRIIAGCAYAIGNLVAPTYLAECAPSAYRALYVNLYQLLLNVGIFLAQVTNAVFAQSPTWRFIAAFPLIPALVLILFAYARFDLQADAVTKGEKGGARLAYAKMRTDPSVTQRLKVAAGLMVAQQMTGVNGVILYAPALISSLGFGERIGNASGASSHFWAASLIGAANCIAGVLAMTAVERTGRRRLLTSGGLTICFSLCVIGFVRWNGGPGIVGVTALVSFIMAFATSFGPLPFLIAAEVFPRSYRGLGLTIVGIASHAASFTVVYGFLQVEKAVGEGVYALFALLTMCCVVFVIKCVPETRGLSLEQIDDLFKANYSDRLGASHVLRVSNNV